MYSREMDLFAAIADPTRRAMLELLRRGERPAGDFGVAFPHLTQPALSRHLRVLREAGLVTVRPEAQSRLYRLRPEGLEALADWVGGLRRPRPERGL
jgi:DNA-binding transcriptional ArsR family regulator